MPFDVIAFGEATPGTDTAGNLLAAALGDTLYFHTGDNIALKADALNLLGVHYGAVSTPGYWRLRQASLHIDYRGIKQHLITAADAICGFQPMWARPLPLYAEVINALSANGTSEATMMGLWVGSGKIPQSSFDAVRPTHQIRGIGDQLVVAYTWTPVSMTWDENLPQGVYAIVGMRVGGYIAAGYNTGYARLLIPGATDWRPGVTMAELSGDKIQRLSPYNEWRMMNQWPLMPEIAFTYDQPPDIEVFSSAALTDFAVELTLQQISERVRGAR